MKATLEFPAGRDEVFALHDAPTFPPGLPVTLGDRQVGTVLGVRVGPGGSSLLVDVELEEGMIP